MPSSNHILRASEIGEYVFCHRAWWLHHLQGIESANRAQMQAGAARQQREQTGLPFNARIVYSDTDAWKKVERSLFSRRYGLAGKPD